MSFREKVAWVLGVMAVLAFVASVAGVAWGGSLDPDGPPGPTGPIQAVLQPAQGRVIQIADDVIVPANTGCEPACGTLNVQGSKSAPVAENNPRHRGVQVVAFGEFTPVPTETSTPDLSTPTSTATATLVPDPSVALGFVDVRDCAKVYAYVEATVAPASDPLAARIRLALRTSPDGLHGFGTVTFLNYLPFLEADVPGDGTAVRFASQGSFGVNDLARGPFVGSYLSRADGLPVDVIVSAWLYCVPE